MEESEKPTKKEVAYTDDAYHVELNKLKPNSLRRRLFTIIFGTDTPAGKQFDIVVLSLIIVSVLAVIFESIPSIDGRYGKQLRIVEWILTICFTLEYLARIFVVSKPRKYVLSFFGIIDLLAILPTYISLFIGGAQGLAIVRSMRLLRVFRILKLMQFVSEGRTLGRALYNSRHKIVIFFLFVLILVFILGSIMYLVEGGENGFNSIPLAVYWAIVTLTTVGFGDITPQTVPGQFIASVIMLIGYAIIAIPTGIVGSEIYRETQWNKMHESSLSCNVCGNTRHIRSARYCQQCGNRLINQAE